MTFLMGYNPMSCNTRLVPTNGSPISVKLAFLPIFFEKFLAHSATLGGLNVFLCVCVVKSS